VPLRHQEKSNNERTVPPHPYPSPAGCGEQSQGIRCGDIPPLPTPWRLAPGVRLRPCPTASIALPTSGNSRLRG